MRVKINHGGKTYHIDWDKSVPPTKEEARKIADDLLFKEQHKPINPIEEIKNSPIGEAAKWLFSSPEGVQGGSDKIKEKIDEGSGPLFFNWGQGNDVEGGREFAKQIVDFATPTRGDIATAGVGLAAKPVLKGLSKAAPKVLSEIGKLADAAKAVKGGELGAEAGVFKFGKNIGSPKPRWKNFELSFASDEDKAAYILAGKGESKAHQAILAQAQKEGLDVEELLERGMKIRQTIKKSEGSATGTSISVPSHGKGTRLGGTNPRSKGKNPRALKVNTDQELEDAVNQIADGSIEKGGDDVVLAGGDKMPPTPPPAENVLEEISSGPKPFFNRSVVKPGEDTKIHMKDMWDLLGPFQRSTQSMLDMSRPLRQAVLPTLFHPKQSLPAVKDMFKAAFNTEHVDDVMKGVDSRPFANIQEFGELGPNATEFENKSRNLYREAGLRMSDLEEAFPSRLAEKIPGLRQATRRSEASYQAYGDKLMPNLFDEVMEKEGFSPDNLPDNQTIRQIGNYINTVSGSGGGGKRFENAVDLMQPTFYSPRMQKSRFDMLNPWNYTGKSDRFGKIGAKYLRKDAAKGAATAGAVLGGTDYLSDDVDVTYNPLSPDFMKVKVGDTRFNPLGALNPMIRFGARGAKNLSNLALGDEDVNEALEPFLGEESANKDVNLGRTITDFARSKLAPGLPSFAADVAFGQQRDPETKDKEITNIIGEPLNDQEYFGKNFDTPFLGYGLRQITPLFPQEIGNILNSDNPDLAAVAAPLGFFGQDSSTYPEREKKPKGVQAFDPYEEIEKVHKRLYGTKK